MNKIDESVVTQEGFELKFRQRPVVTVAVQMPNDVVASMEKVATGRDMSVEALVKLYVGQGLRQDLARMFGDRVLETTAQVLTRHIQSEEEVSEIIREIRFQTAA
ncbi:MAG: hypothetical protein SF097_24610 [Acidobacteriota bacterium]|nr:hypothetical protein [Acidobacteriota bacterium]